MVSGVGRAEGVRVTPGGGDTFADMVGIGDTGVDVGADVGVDEQPGMDNMPIASKKYKISDLCMRVSNHASIWMLISLRIGSILGLNIFIMMELIDGLGQLV